MTGRAAPPHVQLRVVLDHHHPVTVRFPLVSPGLDVSIVISLDLYVVDVIPSVHLQPELPDNLVHHLHLFSVILHDGVVQSNVVLVQVAGHLVPQVGTHIHRLVP